MSIYGKTIPIYIYIGTYILILLDKHIYVIKSLAYRYTVVYTLFFLILNIKSEMSCFHLLIVKSINDN